MICDIKNQVEGAPAEEQICLGWILDSRRLLWLIWVVLPANTIINSISSNQNSFLQTKKYVT